MDVNHFKAKKTHLYEYIDLDEYTEMETASPHDPFSRTGNHNRIKVEKTTNFASKVEKTMGNLRNSAL